MVASTTSAASVMSIIELKKNKNVLQPSISNANNNERLQLVVARHKAQKAQAAGPCQLKCKAVDNISEIPQYKRGCVWKKSVYFPVLSPSALATETALSLTTPPSHPIKDPCIQIHTLFYA
jgi:hypothetical protein